jgi:hypothetical protein
MKHAEYSTHRVPGTQYRKLDSAIAVPTLIDDIKANMPTGKPRMIFRLIKNSMARLDEFA